MIDLRSDTVTRPSKEMLKAMISSPVGDDVFGDDPSVNKLEEKAARMFKKESALFCPSGTMCNQIAIKAHTNPGDEIICDRLSHIYNYEAGGFAYNSGVSIRLIDGDRGRFGSNDIKNNINPDDVHFPVSSLVIIENTCNKGGGSIWDHDEIESISEVCKENNLLMHLDGARLFNAIAETGQKPDQISTLFDSISICLSKGLGAPVGSVLMGSAGFIKQARRIRKVFGGGMRQAGYLAAAGIYALDHNISRIKDDHRRARILGDRLRDLTFVKHLESVDTNIIIFTLSPTFSAGEFINILEKNNILALALDHEKIRMVTHLDFTDEMLKQVLKVLGNIGI
jgi:threonine aldolase